VEVAVVHLELLTELVQLAVQVEAVLVNQVALVVLQLVDKDMLVELELAQHNQAQAEVVALVQLAVLEAVQ
jgi:hypothetical protein